MAGQFLPTELTYYGKRENRTAKSIRRNAEPQRFSTFRLFLQTSKKISFWPPNYKQEMLIRGMHENILRSLFAHKTKKPLNCFLNLGMKVLPHRQNHDKPVEIQIHYITDTPVFCVINAPA